MLTVRFNKMTFKVVVVCLKASNDVFVFPVIFIIIFRSTCTLNLKVRMSPFFSGSVTCILDNFRHKENKERKILFTRLVDLYFIKILL